MKILTKKKQKRLMFDLIDSDRRAFFKFGGTTYFITRDGKVLSSRGTLTTCPMCCIGMGIWRITGGIIWSGATGNRIIREYEV